MQKIVCISGYFNPITMGHIRLIQEAKALGDVLVVIVNNDKQVQLKNSVPFMDENERLEIVKNIKGVDTAVLSQDETRTIHKTLAVVRPNIFANGGDVNDSNLSTHERRVCKELGCEIVFGVGGDYKLQSSSVLIARANAWMKSQEVKNGQGFKLFN